MKFFHEEIHGAYNTDPWSSTVAQINLLFTWTFFLSVMKPLCFLFYWTMLHGGRLSCV
jgi:hypothetical protein